MNLLLQKYFGLRKKWTRSGLDCLLANTDKDPRKVFQALHARLATRS